MFDFLKNGQGEILNLLFLNPEKRYYLAEIAKILGKESSAYQKYIENLINEGILSDERIGNMRFFWLNKNYQLYNEIKAIISKTIGIEAQLKNIIGNFSSIEIAFIFGSFASDKFNSNSDIDLFIVGEVDQDILIERIRELEIKIGRDVNYHVYSREEVMKRINIQNDFINNIFNNKVLLLKGNINDFR